MDTSKKCCNNLNREGCEKMHEMNCGIIIAGFTSDLNASEPMMLNASVGMTGTGV